MKPYEFHNTEREKLYRDRAAVGNTLLIVSAFLVFLSFLTPFALIPILLGFEILTVGLALLHLNQASSMIQSDRLEKIQQVLDVWSVRKRARHKQ